MPRRQRRIHSPALARPPLRHGLQKEPNGDNQKANAPHEQSRRLALPRRALSQNRRHLQPEQLPTCNQLRVVRQRSSRANPNGGHTTRQTPIISNARRSYSRRIDPTLYGRSNGHTLGQYSRIHHILHGQQHKQLSRHQELELERHMRGFVCGYVDLRRVSGSSHRSG